MKMTSRNRPQKVPWTNCCQQPPREGWIALWNLCRIAGAFRKKQIEETSKDKLLSTASQEDVEYPYKTNVEFKEKAINERILESSKDQLLSTASQEEVE